MKTTTNIPKLPLFLLLLLISILSFTYLNLHPFSLASISNPTRAPALRIRPGHYTSSYETYLSHQLSKTQNPKLRTMWTTRDWDRKVRVFTKFFSTLIQNNFINNNSKALCVGARVGQEVLALKQLGVSDTVGIDLVPHPPLVIQGDFHYQPFDEETFDLEFSNVFDHALYPDKFVGEIERTLKVGGVGVLHVAVSKKVVTDKYSANDLLSVQGLVDLFKVSEVVWIKDHIDAFGLDTEVVFRKFKKFRIS